MAIAATFSDRLRLEKELENLVDKMPTTALDILVQYATRLKAVYAAKQVEDDRRQK